MTLAINIVNGDHSRSDEVLSYPEWVVADEAQLECFSSLQCSRFECCRLGRWVVVWRLLEDVTIEIVFVLIMRRHGAYGASFCGVALWERVEKIGQGITDAAIFRLVLL